MGFDGKDKDKFANLIVKWNFGQVKNAWWIKKEHFDLFFTSKKEDL